MQWNNIFSNYSSYKNIEVIGFIFYFLASGEA